MKRFLLSKLFYAALLFVLTINAGAQPLQVQWANAITGTHTVDAGQVVADNQGNIYVEGYFTGTADFDPGPGTANLTSGVLSASGSGYLAKYDAQGNYLFAFPLGDSVNICSITTMVLDNAGNICIAGSFSNTVDFDPGSGTANLTSVGSSDIFVARYDANGNYLNAFRIGGGGIDQVAVIAVDASNNLYITGRFNDTADFDPGAGILNLISGSINENAYFAKYNGNGALVYARSLTSTDDSGAESLAVDASGNAYVGGTFSDDIDLDPGAGTAIFTPVGGSDGFFAKYDAAGNYLYGRNYHGGVNFLTLDSDENIYLSGRVPDSMDMDPGPGVANLYSVNAFDIYFAKYDANDNYTYARALECDMIHVQQGIKTNYQNSLYIYGPLPDTTANFNPGGTGGVLTSAGGRDAYVAKYDANGNFDFAHAFGNTGNDQANGLAVDDLGNIWMTGNFNGTVDFDPGIGTSNLTSSLGRGAFIVKYLDAQAAGVSHTSGQQHSIKIYGADNKVFVDFTATGNVSAEIKVIDLLGQTLIERKHNRNDILKIEMPDAAPQLYLVLVSNNGATTGTKVWIE